jgi:cytochrome c oxidase subunit 2
LTDFNIPFGAASRVAGEVDSVYVFITGIAIFFFLLTQGLLIYFAVKYRRKKGEEDRETPYITGNRVLEGIWIAVPTLLVMSIFAYGYKVWDDMRTPLPGATEINVTARQWLYQFKYPNGIQSINEVRVPVDQPVKFVMTSTDVLHGFFIPELRVKQDILPGRYTYLWIQPEKAGTYTIFCTQYCGAGHSDMTAKLIVMPIDQYQAWAAQEAQAAEKVLPESGRGRALAEKFGCLACHSVDGTTKVGPTWLNLYGSVVTLSDGETVTADENYIRESILAPGAEIVRGFQNIMPTFKGIITDDEIASVIAYIKSLSEKGRAAGEAHGEQEEGHAAPASAARGKELVEKNGCLACHSTDGTAKTGPTFKGLYGRRVPLTDGRAVTADDAYIKESIDEPGAKVVKGFMNIMPPFKGIFTDDDIASITEYIKTLK